MCRGVAKEDEQTRRRNDGGCGSSKALVICELCGENAAVYCTADAALLCTKCDQWVHSANFLARRHFRRVICTSCGKLTRRCLVGDNFNVVLPEMRSMTRSAESNNSDYKVPFVFL